MEKNGFLFLYLFYLYRSKVCRRAYKWIMTFVFNFTKIREKRRAFKETRRVSTAILSRAL